LEQQMGEMKATGNNRIGWLDAWKGFAMLLVVLGHIADGYLDAGLFPAYTKTLQSIYDVIYAFHMPLFFVLSGYAFYLAYAGNRVGRAGKFRLQLWNIAAVYVLFSVIQWCFKMLFSGQVNTAYTLKNLLMIPVKTMAPYWYLYVLLLLYLMGWFAEKWKQPESLKCLFFLGLCFFSDFLPSGILFEIKRTLYYSVFFYFGIFLAKSVAPVCREKLHAALVWYQKIPKAGLFRFLGGYSLEIYVLHCFITAANRVILLKLGISDFYTNIMVNFVTATVLPVLAAWILKKMRLHAYFFKPVSAFTKHTSVK